MAERERHHRDLNEPPESVRMYFQKEIVRRFAAREQNPKNRLVGRMLDRVIAAETSHLSGPLHMAELGGGAHPDRYDELFDRLLREDGSRVDWVDISPAMIELAVEYAMELCPERLDILHFYGQKDMVTYVREQKDASLDLINMKYTIDFLKDLDPFFQEVSRTLKSGGRLVATLTMIDGKIKSHSTNGKYLYKKGDQWTDIPEGEVHQLHNGDPFKIQYLAVSGDHTKGVIPGGEVVKYYFSPQTIESLAKKYGLDVYIGNWSDVPGIDTSDGFTEEELQDNQQVLVMRKG